MNEPSRTVEIERLVAEAVAAIRDVVGADARVVWFGSWITGTAVETSDVDLAVDVGRPLTGREFARIRDRLEELPTLRSFDVLDFDALSAERREAIVAEGRQM